MINEIDADTPGSDTAEFIELYDGGSGNTPLDGLVVVLYDGGSTPFTGNQSYAAFDLSGIQRRTRTATSSSATRACRMRGLTFDPGPFGLLQNGPDAVALYIGHASDFPVGTVVTTANLLDAIVYGTDDPAPANLMPLVNAGQKIVNEDATGNGHDAVEPALPQRDGRLPQHLAVLSGHADARRRQQLPGGAAAKRRRDQPDLRRRRQQRRHLSQRLRRAVQPRLRARRPERLVAAGLASATGELWRFEQAADRRQRSDPASTI